MIIFNLLSYPPFPQLYSSDLLVVGFVTFAMIPNA